MDGYSLTNASEWFQCCCEEDENDTTHRNEEGLNNNNGRLINGLNNEFPLSTFSYELEKLLKTMAPVTTFCAAVPPNNHSSVTTLNNFNRTKSLENLNFTEKRQLIASTLSLAEILQQGEFLRSFSS